MSVSEMAQRVWSHFASSAFGVMFSSEVEYRPASGETRESATEQGLVGDTSAAAHAADLLLDQWMLRFGPTGNYQSLVRADWSWDGTAEEAKIQLHRNISPFVFKGAGWYFTKTDTMYAILIPSDPGETRYRFYVWNRCSGKTTGNVPQEIADIANSPVVYDER